MNTQHVRTVRPRSWCEYEVDRCRENCPLEAADRKLQEAHRHWHDMLDNYQEPDDFRIPLNSAIQALRNVTFALQSRKSQIPHFDEWYATIQTEMRADEKLSWLVEARNTVVKRGDLATHSAATVSLVSNYYRETSLVDQDRRAAEAPLTPEPDTGPEKLLNVTPMRTWADIFLDIERLHLPLKVRADTAVVVERRWVADQFPDHELLALLAHCYGILQQVVLKAHDLMGLRAFEVQVPRGVGPQKVTQAVALMELPHGGRMPCMISTRLVRSARYRLVDGSPVDEFSFFRATPIDDPHLQGKLEQRYGPHPRYDSPEGELHPRPLVEWMAKVAISVLEAGEDHGWFVHLFRQNPLVDARILEAADSPAKHILAAEVADRVEALGADMVAMVGEAWMSPRTETPDGSFVPPGLHSQRRECVLVQAESDSGEAARALVFFETLSGEPPSRLVRISEPVMEDHYTDMFFEPTREVWRRKGARSRFGRGASFFKPPPEV